MAIPFLNNINLSDNQLQNAKLHITGTAPTAAAAQIYFDSSDTIAKYYSNATDTWISLVQTDFADGTFVSLTNGGTSIKRAYTVDLSAVDGTSTSASRFLTKDNTWATIPFGDVTEVQGGTYINVTDQTGPIPIVNHDLTTRTDTTSTAAPAYGATFTAIDSVTTNTTGHITALNVKTITIPASDDTTYDLLTAPTGTAIRLDPSTGTNDDVTISGTTGQTAMSRISASELRVALTDDVTIVDDLTVGGELTVSGTGQSSVAGQLTIPQVPSADTDAASKHYVDQAVTGALSYQGGYNAATNTPDLDSSPSSAIKKGWTYTVTADGLFFTEQVRVGDVLIAEQDAPTTLANWTTVQNNIDLADASTVGIGNVVPGSSNTVTAPYTSGTATLDVVNSSASQKGAVIVAGGTGISVAYASGTATVTNTETNSSNTATGTITAGNLSGTVTHNFGTLNTIVQTIDSSGDTVFCDITRTSNTSVATISATQASNITILVQKIG